MPRVKGVRGLGLNGLGRLRFFGAILSAARVDRSLTTIVMMTVSWILLWFQFLSP